MAPPPVIEEKMELMKNSKKYFWSVSINVTTGIIFENSLRYL
jgi:hypothetical protein